MKLQKTRGESKKNKYLLGNQVFPPEFKGIQNKYFLFIGKEPSTMNITSSKGILQRSRCKSDTDICGYRWVENAG